MDVSTALTCLQFAGRRARGREPHREPLVGAYIAALPRLTALLRPPWTSHEEECSEREAKHDRDRAVVLTHPCPQRLEYSRGPLRRGRGEADERENREYGGTNLGLWSGESVDRSTGMSHYPSCAKASRSFCSCSSGRLVQMISKSYRFRLATTFSP